MSPPLSRPDPGLFQFPLPTLPPGAIAVIVKDADVTDVKLVMKDPSDGLSGDDSMTGPGGSRRVNRVKGKRKGVSVEIDRNRRNGARDVRQQMTVRTTADCAYHACGL